MNNIDMVKLVNFCKQYGFIFQGSEIYGGLANTWDFGPAGALFKKMRIMLDLIVLFL